VKRALLLLALAAAAAPHSAQAPPVDEPKPWTLEAFQAAAQQADPRVIAAAADLQRARGEEEGLRGVGFPVLAYELSGMGPVPEAHNDPDRIDDVRYPSRLRNGILGSFGVTLHLGATLTWPLFTFGKLDAWRNVASRSASASEGLAAAARARAARDAAEVFWSWQAARRAAAGLEEADRQLASARDRVEKLIQQGSTRATKQDVAQLDVVRTELGYRRTEVAAARDLAIEAGRIITGLPVDGPFAFAPTPIEAPPGPLPPLARLEEVALERRPEMAAAQEVLKAREAAVLGRRRAFLPDLALVGRADVNWTGNSTPQTNPFAWDPHNRISALAGLAVQGTLDFGRQSGELKQAQAEVEQARAQVALAARGVRLDVVRAHAALRTAIEKAARMKDQEAAARRWLAQAEFAFDSGLTEAHSVLLAALASARAGAERLSALRDAQVALADLALATGEDPRPGK